MQLQGIAPESLASKRVVTEDMPAACDHLPRMVVDAGVDRGLVLCRALRGDLKLTAEHETKHEEPEQK